MVDEGPRSRRTFLGLVGAAMAGIAGCGKSEGNPSTTKTNTGTSTTTTTNTTTRDQTTSTTEEPEYTTSWPTYGYDLTNAGYVGTVPAAGQNKQWEEFVEGYYTLSAPAVGSEVVCVGSDKFLYAFDRGAGRPLWQYKFNQLAHDFTPTIDEGMIYAGARGLRGTNQGSDKEGALAAIDAKSGDKLWQRGALISGSPTLVEGSIIYPASSASTGSIVAADPSSGEETWRYDLGSNSSAFGTPAFDGDNLYATGNRNDSGEVFALNSNGKELWRFPVQSEIHSAPVVSNGQILIGTPEGKIYSLNADGSKNWSLNLNRTIHSRISAGPNGVYAVAEGQVVAVDRSNVEIAWTENIGFTHYSTIAVSNDTLYVGGDNLLAFRPDGSLQWRKEIDGYAGAYGGPAVVEEGIYIGSCIKEERGDLYDNYLYLLN
ncbi:MAG: PQQ-binding-like beta-propeller repeat protein [Halobacteriaceae archaeon]